MSAIARTAVAVLLTVSSAIIAQPAQTQEAAAKAAILGDFDSEIRRADGHIDIDANLRALKELGANTYFYLIWHSHFDWDDLPAFADAAAKDHISVWVYLIPWSETPLVKRSWGFSEPYRTDYVRWASEIAELSLKHSNIAGFVIDDFYTNTQRDRFSVPYVRQMLRTARDINPRLKFYPLVYFSQPWEEFVARFGPLVDGVVAAYPKSRLQIGNALAYLNDEPHGASVVVDVPRQPTRDGDKGCVWGDLPVTDASQATLSFYWDDDDHTSNRGYHMAYVRVDGRMVWRADTAGDAEDHVVELDLSKIARGRDRLKIELGLLEARGVGKYPVRVKFDDIRVSGFDTPGEMASEKLWTRKATGPLTVNLLPASRETRRFSIPMIVMPAGEGPQHEKRYKEAGSPRHIAAKVATAVEMARKGRVEGVVTYCLPKDTGDPIFQAVRDEYQRIRLPQPEEKREARSEK